MKANRIKFLAIVIVAGFWAMPVVGMAETIHTNAEWLSGGRPARTPRSGQFPARVDRIAQTI